MSITISMAFCLSAPLLLSRLTQEVLQIFFSAHGVPVSYVEQDGDPYKEEMEQCVELIMARLRRLGFKSPHTLAYQSRVGPVRPSILYVQLQPELLSVKRC